MTTEQRPRVGGREKWSERGKKRKEVGRGKERSRCYNVLSLPFWSTSTQA